MDLLLNKMEYKEQTETLKTPIYVRNAQKRYKNKPEIKDRIREQHKLRERKLRENPEYRELCNLRSRESYLRKKELLKKNELSLKTI